MKRWVVGVAVVGVVVAGWYAADAAGRAYADRQTRELIGRLVEDKPGEREQIREALGKLGVEAAPVAADVLRHGDLKERRASLVACRLVVWSCLANFESVNCMTGFVPGRGEAERAFEEVGAALEAAFADADAGVRREAARIILTGPESPGDRRLRAAEVIRQGLSDPDPAARRALVESLCRIDFPGPLPRDRVEALWTLGDAVKDPDAAVRKAAVEALDRGRELGAVPLLVGAMGDRDAEVRRAAERACLNGDYLPGFAPRKFEPFTPEVRAAFRSDVPFFVGWLKDGDPQAARDDNEKSRCRGVLALHWARGPEVVAPLLDALRDSRHDGDRTFRRVVALALEDLASDDGCLAVLKGRGAELRAALTDPYNPDVRSSAASISRRLGPEAEGVVAELVARSADPRPRERVVAVNALGAFAVSSEEACRALRRVAEGDVDARVREAAARGLEGCVSNPKGRP